jgi:hypothetical protein
MSDKRYNEPIKEFVDFLFHSITFYLNKDQSVTKIDIATHA